MRFTAKTFFNMGIHLICFIHSSRILYNMLNPDEPSVRSYEKDLSEMPFPLLFKMCVEAEVPYTKEDLLTFGYGNLQRYYKGMSTYNKSWIGWAGMAENGSSLDLEKGIQRWKSFVLFVLI